MKRNKLMNGMARLALAACCLAACSAAWALDITWTNEAGGDFSNPLNWSPNQVPGATDTAIFNIVTPEPYTVTWNTWVTNTRFSVTQGKLIWNLNGQRYGITSGGPTFGAAGYNLDLVITNGNLQIATATPYYSFQGTTTVRFAAGVTGNLGRPSVGVYTGSRVIVDGARFSSSQWAINNGGTLIVTNGGYLDSGSKVIQTYAGGKIQVSGSGSHIVGALGLTGTRFAGNLAVTQGAVMEAWGVNGPSYINGGQITLDDGYLIPKGTTTILNYLGVIEGDGSITSSVVNASGWIRPGGENATGLLIHKNNFVNYEAPTSGTIEIELGGPAPVASDRFAVIGTLYAGGTLAVSLIDGFQPATGDTFDILDFNAVDGEFGTLDFPGSTANWDLSKLYTTGEIRYRPVGTVLMVQ